MNTKNSKIGGVVLALMILFSIGTVSASAYTDVDTVLYVAQEQLNDITYAYRANVYRQGRTVYVDIYLKDFYDDGSSLLNSLYNDIQYRKVCSSTATQFYEYLNGYGFDGYTVIVRLYDSYNNLLCQSIIS